MGWPVYSVESPGRRRGPERRRTGSSVRSWCRPRSSRSGVRSRTISDPNASAVPGLPARHRRAVLEQGDAVARVGAGQPRLVHRAVALKPRAAGGPRRRGGDHLDEAEPQTSDDDPDEGAAHGRATMLHHGSPLPQFPLQPRDDVSKRHRLRRHSGRSCHARPPRRTCRPSADALVNYARIAQDERYGWPQGPSLTATAMALTMRSSSF